MADLDGTQGGNSASWEALSAAPDLKVSYSSQISPLRGSFSLQHSLTFISF